LSIFLLFKVFRITSGSTKYNEWMRHMFDLTRKLKYFENFV